MRLRPRCSTSAQASFGFGREDSAPTTTVFSTLWPSVSRFCSSGTPTLFPLSFALPSSVSPVATSQPSVPIVPASDLGRTILVLCRDENQDFSGEETAAASSLRRKRQTRLAPSPIG